MFLVRDKWFAQTIVKMFWKQKLGGDSAFALYTEEDKRERLLVELRNIVFVKVNLCFFLHKELGIRYVSWNSSSTAVEVWSMTAAQLTRFFEKLRMKS